MSRSFAISAAAFCTLIEPSPPGRGDLPARPKRMKLQMHIDGGSRGNPGPSAGGVVLADERGTAVLEAGYFFGVHTNNEAEYTALLRGLDAAVGRGVTELTIYSDSEL